MSENTHYGIEVGRRRLYLGPETRVFLYNGENPLTNTPYSMFDHLIAESLMRDPLADIHMPNPHVTVFDSGLARCVAELIRRNDGSTDPYAQVIETASPNAEVIERHRALLVARDGGVLTLDDLRELDQGVFPESWSGTNR